VCVGSKSSTSTPSTSTSPPFTSMTDVPQTRIDVPIGAYGKPTSTIPMITLDCDHVMEAYIEAGQYDRDPYWTCIWPSSQAIAALLLDGSLPRGDRLEELRVADFGAGLGLAGVAAAKKGAGEVVFLDREPLSLECCVANAELNGVGDRCVPFEFDWNLPVGPLEHSFDVILVCDCLYEKFSVEPIARVLPKLLSLSPGATVVLADPPNRARANREKFLGLMKVCNFEIRDESRVDVNEMMAAGHRQTEVVLMQLCRRSETRL